MIERLLHREEPDFGLAVSWKSGAHHDRSPLSQRPRRATRRANPFNIDTSGIVLGTRPLIHVLVGPNGQTSGWGTRGQRTGSRAAGYAKTRVNGGHQNLVVMVAAGVVRRRRANSYHWKK